MSSDTTPTVEEMLKLLSEIVPDWEDNVLRDSLRASIQALAAERDELLSVKVGERTLEEWRHQIIKGYNKRAREYTESEFKRLEGNAERALRSRDDAQRRLAEIAELHHENAGWCCHCEDAWPCLTIQIATGSDEGGT